MSRPSCRPKGGYFSWEPVVTSSRGDDEVRMWPGPPVWCPLEAGDWIRRGMLALAGPLYDLHQIIVYRTPLYTECYSRYR